MSFFPPSAATDPSLPHDSLVSHIIGICSAMLILVTLVVLVRSYVRLKLTKGRAGADDWCIMVAWVLAVAFDLDPINQTKFGLGQHIYDLAPGIDFSASLKLYYCGEIIYYICVAVTKIAILNLYLRLAVQRNYRRLIWACIGFVVLSTLACVLASIFQCSPIHKAWDVRGTVSGSCINVNGLFLANAGLDIFQDAVIYVLPMRMLYQIQIPKRQKIALMLVFAIGGFVVITGMVRLNYLKKAQNSPDPSYNNYGGAVWSAIECNIGVVCASLPSFKPLIDRFFPSLMGHSRGVPNVTPQEVAAARRRGYTRKTSESDLELEHGGGGWTYPATSRYTSSATAHGGPPSGARGNEEHAQSGDAGGRDGGIWRSTEVVVDHS